MNELSTFLFAMPSFLGGAARVLDLGDTFTEYNRAVSPDMADYLALRADWRVVGDDLRTAMQEYAAEHPELTGDAVQR